MAFRIGPSKIQGKGVLATRPLKKGESLGEVIVYEWWGWLPSPQITEDLGVWVNHSYEPNAELQWRGTPKAWHLVMTKPVKRGGEITIDYADTPWYIEGPLSHYV